MLHTCFTHLPGVGPAFDARLRAAGILQWSDALDLPLPCSPTRAETLRRAVEESLQRLEARDAGWFGRCLAPAEHWRLFPHFRDAAAYVDIETTGLHRERDCITTIALFDGTGVRTYVRGVNLEKFSRDILSYKLLITWNGRGFDAPILRASLNIPLDTGDMAHLDLLPVYRTLGLRGGLKKVEAALGLSREELDGVDGWAAVRLWREYRRSKDPRALETLLAYNAADVLGLEFLAEYALFRHQGLPHQQAGRAAAPALRKTALNPFSPHLPLLRRMGILAHAPLSP